MHHFGGFKSHCPLNGTIDLITSGIGQFVTCSERDGYTCKQPLNGHHVAAVRVQTGRFFERKSAEILSGCFDGCSLPTFVHLAAMDCNDGLFDKTFIRNYLCDSLRVIATRCKTSKNRLKIRRPLRSWGFDPPSRHQANPLNPWAVEASADSLDS